MFEQDPVKGEVWRPLIHNSRSLTKIETNYGQAWWMGQHSHYLLCRQFIIHCDHAPLLPFYSGRKKVTPRLEKHLLKIQDLKFKMELKDASRLEQQTL
jgi:hypothetical protein